MLALIFYIVVLMLCRDWIGRIVKKSAVRPGATRQSAFWRAIRRSAGALALVLLVAIPLLSMLAAQSAEQAGVMLGTAVGLGLPVFVLLLGVAIYRAKRQTKGLPDAAEPAAQRLDSLRALFNRGDITEHEFAEQKARILGEI